MVLRSSPLNKKTFLIIKALYCRCMYSWGCAILPYSTVGPVDLVLHNRDLDFGGLRVLELGCSGLGFWVWGVLGF